MWLSEQTFPEKERSYVAGFRTGLRELLDSLEERLPVDPVGVRKLPFAESQLQVKVGPVMKPAVLRILYRLTTADRASVLHGGAPPWSRSDSIRGDFL